MLLTPPASFSNKGPTSQPIQSISDLVRIPSVPNLAVMGIRSAIRRRLADLAREAVESIVPTIVDRVAREIGEHQFRERRDISFAQDVDAARSSAILVNARMAEATAFWNPLDTLHASLREAQTGGLALEFGVFEGRTLRLISEARNGADVYGFDSFQGLPETWREGFAKGEFEVDAPPHIPGAVLVPGWFDETLAPFLETHPGPIDFAHIDCDLYSSTVTVLNHIAPRLRVGSVLQFDEYFNYPGWESGEFLAFDECVARTGIQFEYRFFTANNEQVSVQIIRVP